MITGNEPVYPFLEANESGNGDSVVIYDSTGSKQILPFNAGITKREYFAAMALQGLLASDLNTTLPALARIAVLATDELMTELNKQA